MNGKDTTDYDRGFGAGVKYATDWLRERGYGYDADRIAEQARVPEAMSSPIPDEHDEEPSP